MLERGSDHVRWPPEMVTCTTKYFEDPYVFLKALEGDDSSHMNFTHGSLRDLIETTAGGPKGLHLFAVYLGEQLLCVSLYRPLQPVL